MRYERPLRHKETKDLMMAANNVIFEYDGIDSLHLHFLSADKWTELFGFYPQVYIDSEGYYTDDPYSIYSYIIEELQIRGYNAPTEIKSNLCGKCFVFRDGKIYRIGRRKNQHYVTAYNIENTKEQILMQIGKKMYLF